MIESLGCLLCPVLLGPVFRIGTMPSKMTCRPGPPPVINQCFENCQTTGLPALSTIAAPTMTLADLPISPASLQKQASKKSLTLAYKYAAAAEAARKGRGDCGMQSTDNRRKYMRRGSKTPAMLMFDSFNWDFLRCDLQGNVPINDPVQSCCDRIRLDLAVGALSAASECFADFDHNAFHERQQQMMAHSVSTKLSTHRAEHEPLNATPKVATSEPPHLSLMVALKQQMENTSISSSSRSLQRRLSSDLIR
jgi:hypothetical protein